MLKPVNLIVFDSTNLYDTLLKEFPDNVSKAEAALDYIANESDETLVSFYLPVPEERQYYEEIASEIADIIVKNSNEVQYGDTVYILF